MRPEMKQKWRAATMKQQRADANGAAGGRWSRNEEDASGAAGGAAMSKRELQERAVTALQVETVSCGGGDSSTSELQ